MLHKMQFWENLGFMVKSKDTIVWTIYVVDILALQRSAMSENCPNFSQLIGKKKN